MIPKIDNMIPHVSVFGATVATDWAAAAPEFVELIY